MAVLLRFLHFPSLTHYFPPEQQQLTRTPLSNLSTYNYKHNLSHSVSIKTKRLGTSNFVLRFSSSTTQEQAQAPSSSSSSTNVSTETQVLEPETEEFSRDRLIAQNVPWSCTAEDVRTLFEKHGTVLDVELSMHNKVKNRGLAFVTMGSPEEALTALNNLDSYEFEGRTLKINYARARKKKPSPPPVQPKPLTFNLFVANLPFEARSKDLREFFGSENSSLVSAQVIFHENPRKSSGYGFVAFKYKKDADEALSSFQGKIFMGRPIRIARSRQFVKLRAEENAESGDTSTTEESAESGDTSTELNSSVEQADTADENGK
ncbi:28 kDa ribonucleoprotein, chloroplastic [Quercus lobata]|uniref:RRM domain-containing protein n=1 Tax=Quercus lobata TaxID=97700 RepID=A0A7N2KRM4_QUELO|nr:28 kDa ribonucleoprotein, chloroplastic [Quercus lobata]